MSDHKTPDGRVRSSIKANMYDHSVRPTFRRNWMIEGQVSVPTLVLHDRTVPGPARLLYCLLCSYADQPHRQWNGLAGLADDLDMSSEQVVGLMEVLVKRYFISVVRLKEAASRNIYIIADLDDIYSARAGEVKIRTPRPG